MTLGELRAAVAQVVDSKDVTGQRRDAIHLLSGVLGMRPGDVVLRADREVPPADAERALIAARRYAEGVPLAYATGSAAFRALELLVDDRVLIPRPETEGLVDRVLAWQAVRGPGGVAVDVGTGSGCIALSLATEGRFDRVIGIDQSAAALVVARANGVRVGATVEWREGDLLAPVRGVTPVVIVSNPPYIAEAEWEHLAPGVRDHEPRMALVADDEGMALTARLAREAFSCLRVGGLLAVEVDSARAERACEYAREAGFGDVSVAADLFGRPRYLLAIKE
jgi:release factor glutamine methyltransferase